MEKTQSTQSNKTAVLLVAILSSFLTPFSSSSVNIILPEINRHLSLNAVELSWIATSYLLAASVFLVPMGRLADIYGRKNIFRAGIIIDIAASILCAFPLSGAWLIGFRALQGLGGSMIFGTSIAILTSEFPIHERGRVLGFNAAAVYVGLSIGPLVGGFLGQHLGWRSVFLFNALIGLTIVTVIFWKLKGEWAEARGEKFDLVGSVLYGLTLISVVYGFSVITGYWGIRLIVAGILFSIIFVVWELRQAQPVLKVAFFVKNRVFGLSNLSALINYSATFAVGFLLSLYLQDIQHLSSSRAGLVLIVQPVVMVICSLIAGRLSDKHEPGLLSSVGMGITTVGLIILCFLNDNSSLALVIFGLVVLGIGFGFFTSPNTNAVMSSVERKYYGVASGIMGTSRLLGQTFSLGIVTLLFAVFIGAVPIVDKNYPDFLKSLHVTFIISAVLCFAGIFASAFRGRIRVEK